MGCKDEEVVGTTGEEVVLALSVLSTFFLLVQAQKSLVQVY
jgi:hypothetical protein